MKIIIATKNMSKFEIISKMLTTIFNEKINIKNLNDVNKFKELEEKGNNIERAKSKAWNTYNNINESFDAIIGIDDGIIINDIEYVSVKKHLHDIIIGNSVPVGSQIYITRAYYLITCDGKEQYCYNKIPYIVQKKLKSLKIEGYPLNNVISTIDDKVVLSDRSDDELNNYFLKYSLKDLEDLMSIINKEMNEL